jgi:hypothetical protein
VQGIKISRVLMQKDALNQTVVDKVSLSFLALSEPNTKYLQPNQET